MTTSSARSEPALREPETRAAPQPVPPPDEQMDVEKSGSRLLGLRDAVAKTAKLLTKGAQTGPSPFPYAREITTGGQTSGGMKLPHSGPFYFLIASHFFVQIIVFPEFTTCFFKSQ
jgi:hypothetical protein